MSRIFLIHGWGGSPKSDWFVWAKKELENKGYEVFVPEMPDSEHPEIEPWLNKLAETITIPKPNDILVGHSIGTLAVLRYLQTLMDGQKVQKVILVAPWQTLTLGEEEDPDIAVPWQKEDIDYRKIKTKADKFVALFSRDDPWVPFEENNKYFQEKLNPEIIIKEGMGHFNMSEIPLLLELIN